MDAVVEEHNFDVVIKFKEINNILEVSVVDGYLLSTLIVLL